MRNLDECKAEVFRRSNERIKERKRNRNRIFACGATLLFCIIAFSVVILQMRTPANNAKPEADGMSTVKSSDMGSLVCSYKEVEIQYASEFSEYYQKVIDRVAVTEIFSVIYSFYDTNDGLLPSAGEQNIENENNAAAGGSSEINACVITFICVDGSETVYTLKENELLNESTDEKIILSDSQLAELKEVIGMSE